MKKLLYTSIRQYRFEDKDITDELIFKIKGFDIYGMMKVEIYHADKRIARTDLFCSEFVDFLEEGYTFEIRKENGDLISPSIDNILKEIMRLPLHEREYIKLKIKQLRVLTDD